MTARDLWRAPDALASSKSRSSLPSSALSRGRVSITALSPRTARRDGCSDVCRGGVLAPRRRAHPCAAGGTGALGSSEAPVVSIKQQEDW